MFKEMFFVNIGIQIIEEKILYLDEKYLGHI